MCKAQSDECIMLKLRKTTENGQIYNFCEMVKFIIFCEMVKNKIFREMLKYIIFCKMVKKMNFYKRKFLFVLNSICAKFYFCELQRE